MATPEKYLESGFDEIGKEDLGTDLQENKENTFGKEEINNVARLSVVKKSENNDLEITEAKEEAIREGKIIDVSHTSDTNVSTNRGEFSANEKRSNKKRKNNSGGRGGNGGRSGEAVKRRKVVASRIVIGVICSGLAIGGAFLAFKNTISNFFGGVRDDIIDNLVDPMRSTFNRLTETRPSDDNDFLLPIKTPTSEPTKEPTPEPTPESTEKAVVEEVMYNKEATPNPTEEPIPEETPEVKISWPKVEGLVLKDGTYTYEKGNPYGGKEGEYAGKVVENISVEGEKVGGIVFTSKVCEKLLKDELAKIPNSEPSSIFVIPLDISSMVESDSLNISFIRSNKNRDIGGFLIKSSVHLSLVNNILGEDSQFAAGSGVFTYENVDSSGKVSTYKGINVMNTNSLLEKINNEKAFKFLNYVIPRGKMEYGNNLFLSFGEDFGFDINSLMIYISGNTARDPGSEIISLESSSVLTFENKKVFVSSNK